MVKRSIPHSVDMTAPRSGKRVRVASAQNAEPPPHARLLHDERGTTEHAVVVLGMGEDVAVSHPHAGLGGVDQHGVPLTGRHRDRVLLLRRRETGYPSLAITRCAMGCRCMGWILFPR